MDEPVSNPRATAARVAPTVLPTVVQATVHTVAAGIVLVSTFLPWLWSGDRWRSSYDLLGVVDRLGFAPDGVVSHLVGWWPVVPLAVTGSVVASWWRRPVIAASATAVAMTYAGGVAVAMVVASRRSPLFDLGIGPWIGAVASVGCLAAAAWWCVDLIRARPTGRAARTPRAAPPVDRS